MELTYDTPMSLTNFPNGIMAFPVVGASNVDMFGSGKTYFADGDLGSDGNDGLSPLFPTATIQKAVDNAAVNGGNASVYVKARKPAVGATDPVSYNENVIVPATCPNTRIMRSPGRPCWPAWSGSAWRG